MPVEEGEAPVLGDTLAEIPDAPPEDAPPAVETSPGEEEGEVTQGEETAMEETGDAPVEGEGEQLVEPAELTEPGESTMLEPSTEEVVPGETEGLTTEEIERGEVEGEAVGEEEARENNVPDVGSEGRVSPTRDELGDDERGSAKSETGRVSPDRDDGLEVEASKDDDDGKDKEEGDYALDEGDYGLDEEDEEDKVDPLQDLQEKYEQLLEMNEQADHTNKALQRRVIQRKAQDKSYDASEKQSEGKVTEHKYQNVLLHVHQVRLKLRLQQVKAARMSEELKNQLEAKRQKAIECRDSFQEFKRQVARHAEYARTGKKIPEKIIQEVEEFELDKDAEVEEVRGSNISLKNRLAKLEQQLRKKDELAENLHVIDFEQLKIENQTLNEKIEERNEELHKLRKKTIVTVQIITHMREKVQFVQQEYLALKSELAQLDLDLAAQRELVTRTKHERDDIRGDIAKHRQQTGITNSEGLSRDYEARAVHIKELIEEIAQLKNRHKQMLQFLKRHGGKV